MRSYSMFRKKRNPSCQNTPRSTFLPIIPCSSRCWQSIWIWMIQYTNSTSPIGIIYPSPANRRIQCAELHTTDDTTSKLRPSARYSRLPQSRKERRSFLPSKFIMHQAVFIRPSRNVQCALVAAIFMKVSTIHAFLGVRRCTQVPPIDFLGSSFQKRTAHLSAALEFINSRSSFALLSVCLSECNETRPSQPSICSCESHFSVLCPDPHTFSIPLRPRKLTDMQPPTRYQTSSFLQFSQANNDGEPNIPCPERNVKRVGNIDLVLFRSYFFPPSSHISGKVATLARRTGLDHSFWSAYSRSSLG
jgi:hypothetical protein